MGCQNVHELALSTSLPMYRGAAEPALSSASNGCRIVQHKSGPTAHSSYCPVTVGSAFTADEPCHTFTGDEPPGGQGRKACRKACKFIVLTDLRKARCGVGGTAATTCPVSLGFIKPNAG